MLRLQDQRLALTVAVGQEILEAWVDYTEGDACSEGVLGGTAVEPPLAVEPEAEFDDVGVFSVVELSEDSSVSVGRVEESLEFFFTSSQ